MATDEAARQKARIRAQSRTARRTRVAGDVDGSTRSTLGGAMCDAVMAELRRRGLLDGPGCVAVFVSTDAEPDTRALRTALHDAGVRVLIPRVAGEQLEWCIDDETAALAPSAWGISEPTSPAVSAGADALISSVAVILPALAIDERGYRIGQGGGFYDRALAQLDAAARPLLIGLVFDDEVIDEAPREAHDIPVDIVITERRVIPTRA